MTTISMNYATIQLPALCPVSQREARRLAREAAAMGAETFLADEQRRKFAGCPEVLRELTRQGVGVSIGLEVPGGRTAGDLSEANAKEPKIEQRPVVAAQSPSPKGDQPTRRTRGRPSP